MSIVQIDGEEYCKASTLAKKYRYTNDYIGQLCRSGKVKATLVGRSWYVSEESLVGHKRSRYVKSSLDEKSVVIEPEIEISRVSTIPIHSGKVVKNLQPSREKNFAKRMDWKPVSYELDETALIPNVGTSRDNKVKVNLAESTKVKINKLSNTTFLASDKLPEITMRGEVGVNSVFEDLQDDVVDDYEQFSYHEEGINEKPLFTPKSISQRRQIESEVAQPVVAFGFTKTLVLIVPLLLFLSLSVTAETVVVADVFSYETHIEISPKNLPASLLKS